MAINSLKMKKVYTHNYRVEEETTVLSIEEQMKQAQLKAYINNITGELKRARNKEELIDMLKWVTRSVENYNGL